MYFGCEWEINNEEKRRVKDKTIPNPPIPSTIWESIGFFFYVTNFIGLGRAVKTENP